MRFLSSGEIGIEAMAEMMDEDAGAICGAVKQCRQAAKSRKPERTKTGTSLIPIFKAAN